MNFRSNWINDLLENDYNDLKLSQSFKEKNINGYMMPLQKSLYDVNETTTNWIENEKNLNMFNIPTPNLSYTIDVPIEEICYGSMFKENNNFELFRFEFSFKENILDDKDFYFSWLKD